MTNGMSRSSDKSVTQMEESRRPDDQALAAPFTLEIIRGMWAENSSKCLLEPLLFAFFGTG